MAHWYLVNVSCYNKHFYRQATIVIIVFVIPSSRILGHLLMKKAESLQKDRINEHLPLLIITGGVQGDTEQ